VPEGTFEVADVSNCELPRVDTILLIDVLHYLPLAEQDRLLQSAARAVAPAGRVLIRELDAEPTARSASTRFFEWFFRKIGVNRGRAAHYRSAADVLAVLEGCGLPSQVQGASERTPFANVLIVAGGSPSSNVQAAASAPSTLTSAAKA
jgi:hypothetical protein